MKVISWNVFVNFDTHTKIRFQQFKKKQIKFREKISGFIDLGLGVPSNEQNITQEFLM